MIDYRDVLADLESRRSEIDGAILAIQRILRAENQQPKPKVEAEKDGNITRTVHGFLSKEPLRMCDVRAIVQGTGLTKKEVRGALARLYKTGRVQRPKRGKYRVGKSQEPTAVSA